jgi:hypothetical protein
MFGRSVRHGHAGDVAVHFISAIREEVRSILTMSKAKLAMACDWMRRQVTPIAGTEFASDL